MSLASLADMVRYGFTGDAAAAAPWLEVAEALVKSNSKRDWELAGAQEETFYDQRQGDLIAVLSENASDWSIRVYQWPTDAGRLLDPSEYSARDKGRVRLLFTTWPSTKPANLIGYQRKEVGIGDALAATERGPPVKYERVVASYTATAGVPPEVRDAVALIATHNALTAVREAAGLRSEQMGDYRYDIASSNGQTMTVLVPPKAIMLLREHAGSGSLWPGIPGMGPIAAGQVLF